MSATSEILSAYQHVLSKLTLIMGSKGIFDVHMNGELVFSKGKEGRYPEEGELLEHVKAIAGPDVLLYGS